MLYQDSGEILVTILSYDMIEKYLNEELDEKCLFELMIYGIIGKL
jgi:hypothetical protein